jgi:DNA-binding transcriptional LysR family regulator
VVDLKKLRYFAVTAAEGSFHKASAKLHIAQPALSRQIRDLEAEIGACLFVRTSQGVSLTPAGEVLLAQAERLLAQLEFAKDSARRAGAGRFGSLRIGLTTAVAELRPAISAVAAAARLNPQVDYRLSVVASDLQLPALQSGDIDVGLLYRRAPLLANMKFRDLRIDHYVLAVPSGHRLTRQKHLRLTDLAGEPLIFISRAARPITFDELMTACLKGGLSPQIAFELEGEGIVLNMVAEGMGLGFFNGAMSARRPLEGVTYLTIEDLDITLHMAAMWNADRESPAIHDFINLVIDHMDRAAKSDVNT